MKVKLKYRFPQITENKEANDYKDERNKYISEIL